MQERPPDFDAIIRVLAAAEAEFVVIGGMALVLHGGTSVTVDCDLAVASSRENTAAIVKALAELEPKPIYWHEGTNFVWDERSLSAPTVKLRTTAGNLDLLFAIPGVESYDALAANAEVFEVAGVRVRVANLDDLASMKRSAGRLKDQIHLLEIDELKRLRPD